MESRSTRRHRRDHCARTTCVPRLSGLPEADSAVFLPRGWFRTGDVGRIDEDGFLFVTGRLKEMIKRAGLSISPREIEDVLLTDPAVAEACVFGIPHPDLGEDVAAAVVIRPGATVTERLLRGPGGIAALATEGSPQHHLRGRDSKNANAQTRAQRACRGSRGPGHAVSQ